MQQLAETLGGSRRACLCREISKVFAESKRGTLSELAAFYQENEPKGEMVLVVEGSPNPVYAYPYPRPAVTVDFLLLAKVGHLPPHLLLVERGREPFQGCYAFPGGFVDEDETLEWAAGRELREETGIRLKDYGLTPLPFRPYSEPGRDPRGRTITMVYYAVLETEELPEVQGQDDARRADWFPLDSLPALAFDHGSIIQEFRQTLGL